MLRGVLAVFAILILAGLAGAWTLPWRDVYLVRVLAWNSVGIDDYTLFPERAVANEPPATTYPPAARPLSDARLGPAVQRHFSATGADSLEDFLSGTNTTAFIVLFDGQLAYEGYFNGHARTSTETSFSAAKSFVSALVGIAIAEGKIGGVGDPISTYLPALADRDLGAITIEQLLTMRSGLAYDESGLPWSDDALTYYGPDLKALALAQSVETSPGTEWRYNDYNLLLIGMVLERATGKPVAEYLSEKIWRPLGMTAPASWSLDEHGFEKMATGINARAIDFATFGQLFLQNGTWQGRAIVPDAWVAASATLTEADGAGLLHVDPDWKPGALDLGYKYYWWVHHRDDGRDDFFASGNLGQYIYVSPANRVVIVRTGFDWGDYRGWVRFLGDVADAAAATGP